MLVLNIKIYRLYNYNMRYSDCNIDSRPLHCSIVTPSMDRPPSYSDACNAPLLYETPFNKVCLFSIR